MVVGQGWRGRAEKRERKNLGGKPCVYICIPKSHLFCAAGRSDKPCGARDTIFIYMYTTYNTFLGQTLYIYKYSRVTPEPSVYIYV